MIALIVCVLLIGLMLVGVPVCVAMGATSAGVFAALGFPNILAVMAQRIYNGTTGFTLLAIPFFILAGNLMNTGGITDRIFNFAKAMVGHWPGGLGQVNILSSVVFSGMSGAAVADAAGLGIIEMKAMDDAGYDHRFSAGITAASATIGPVIPPSIPFVVFASCTGVSVSRLFAAGFIPGLLMALAMAVCVYVISRRKHFPVTARMPWKVRLLYFWKAIPSLLTIVIIIGGIWGGLFTPTEAAIIATFYALFLSSVVYRQITWKKLMNIVYDSLLTSCKTLFIIAIANFLAYFMLHQRIPNMVIQGMLSVTADPQALILMIIFVLLVLGMFLEGTAVILIVTPIFLPIIDKIGMNYVQFGVIVILASMIGLLTPPVGMSLYAVSSVTGVRLLDLSREVLPYVFGIFLVLLLCAFWPPLSLWIPSLLG
ncbi:MAG: TRAP transporter large permease [Clostridiales bacterium]|nr:TRAP transporter large permease [Clostridiales bacterium]